MKKFRVSAFIFRLLFIALLCNYSAFAQKTTIWMVRHAEKDQSDPANQNPTLTDEGKQRAAALQQTLTSEPIAAIFVTTYQRTALTAQPIALKLKLVPQVYSTADNKAIISKVLKEYQHKTVLIVAHSNTILPMLSAFGLTPPFEKLTDDDYDMLYKITIDDKGKPELTMGYYGKSHHSQAIPQAFLNTN